MNASNKIVLKINYQKVDEKSAVISAPRRVNEWRVKRILTAFALLLFIVLLVFYFLNRLPDVAEKQAVVSKGAILLNPEASIKATEAILEISANDAAEIVQIKPAIPAEVVAVDIKASIASNEKKETTAEIKQVTQVLIGPGVARALLTRGIYNKEPLDHISSYLTVNKEKATGVYYFTELRGKKGQVISHHWLWNNKLIFQKKFKIFGNRWRIATSKVIPYAKAGLWIVRLVNEEGDLLNEINFEVIKEE
jgi:hypothetical protein